MSHISVTITIVQVLILHGHLIFTRISEVPNFYDHPQNQIFSHKYNIQG